MSAGAALIALQTAVYTALAADSGLASVGAGVYDEVPDSQAMPYVTIGDTTNNAWDVFPTSTRSGTGWEATLTLHIWSRYRGQKETLQILDRIGVVLDKQALTVTGFDLDWAKLEFHMTMRDADGITRHTPVRFRFRLRDQT